MVWEAWDSCRRTMDDNDNDDDDDDDEYIEDDECDGDETNTSVITISKLSILYYMFHFGWNHI